MNKVYTIFTELLKLCPGCRFDKATEHYNGDRYVKTFKTWQHEDVFVSTIDIRGQTA